MWGIDSVCDLRGRVSRRGGSVWGIGFVGGGGGCVCLVAVMLLWAPGWGAALQAAGLGCCDGAMCPLHGHGPKKSSSDTNSAKDTPMAGCEHHVRPAAMDCTVVCCHPKDPAVTG